MDFNRQSSLASRVITAFLGGFLLLGIMLVGGCWLTGSIQNGATAASMALVAVAIAIMFRRRK